MTRIKIYDTTLRDGTQAEGISFSLEDKVKIAQKLDELGIHYIEGGWPGSNPKDIKFFQRMKRIKLKNAKLTAFGSTRRAKYSAEKDPNIRALLGSGTEVVCIFGKSWDLHVKVALGVSLEKNLELIEDSISYLKKKQKEVIYDAEHFFDGYKDSPTYALKTLDVAQRAGADWIVLCDTNGGTLPFELSKIMREIRKKIKVPLGIHAHNDSGVAVANTLAAVEEGALQVQGTINGLGERCGNVNLCSVIPNLQLKMGIDCIKKKQLAKLTEVSRYIAELANLPHDERQPFVGNSSFAHKGGIHVSAVKKDPRTYEHILPDLVGNHRRILVSELAGRSNILYKAKEYGLDLEKKTPQTVKVLEDLKRLEDEGYQFEGAEGSFELLMKKALGKYRSLFDLEGFRVTVEKRKDGNLNCEATIKVKVEGIEEHTAAEGRGPINALDNALRKALEEFYPSLKKVRLTDYKVRVLDVKAGTAAPVRVLVEARDKKERWGTVGVSTNIIEASWQALVDSLEYKLLKKHKRQ
jgi:2-isopropylmalate synthase